MQAIDHLPIYDAGNAQEIVAYGLAKVEIIGALARFYLHIPQEIGGTRYRVIVAVVNMPSDTIPDQMAMTSMAMEDYGGKRLAS